MVLSSTMIMFCLDDVYFGCDIAFRPHAIIKAESLFVTFHGLVSRETGFRGWFWLSWGQIDCHMSTRKDLNLEELLQLVAPRRVVLVVNVEFVVPEIVQAE